jgi:hypothetical protein
MLPFGTTVFAYAILLSFFRNHRLITSRTIALPMDLLLTAAMLSVCAATVSALFLIQPASLKKMNLLNIMEFPKSTKMGLALSITTIEW